MSRSVKLLTLAAILVLPQTALAQNYISVGVGTDPSNLEDGNLSGTVAIGHDFGNKRVELEYSHVVASENFEKVVLGYDDGDEPMPDVTVSFQDDVTTRAIVAMAYVDFGEGRVQPFVGLGAGFTFQDTRLDDPIGQAAAGVSLVLTPKFALVGQYTYVSDFDGDESNRVTAGARLTF